ncbi:MAG: HD domain-containing protein [Heliobacteriaceae bacterium]|nr:HD domain-containing protein [Heliobacteriaceae bacterium]
MGIEINSLAGAGGINSNTGIYRQNFGNNTGMPADSFENNSISRYTTEAAIKKMILNNPKIDRIMKEINAPIVLNMAELKTLQEEHAADVKNIAAGVAGNLPFALKSKVDLKSLEDAAYLHDIGKVLIPAQILNKTGELDPKEKEIMSRHAELGYELLKTTGINNYTLNLVRNHHQNAKRTGYPWVQKDFYADISLQILAAADKYSALLEKRPYKNSIPPKQALTIIYQDVKENKLHPFVFRALVDYVNTQKHVAINSV